MKIWEFWYNNNFCHFSKNLGKAEFSLTVCARMLPLLCFVILECFQWRWHHFQQKSVFHHFFPFSRTPRILLKNLPTSNSLLSKCIPLCKYSRKIQWQEVLLLHGHNHCHRQTDMYDDKTPSKPEGPRGKNERGKVNWYSYRQIVKFALIKKYNFTLYQLKTEDSYLP